MLIVVNFEYCNLYERYPKVIKVVATLHIRCSLAVVILLSGLTAVNGILTSLNDAARSDLSQGRSYKITELIINISIVALWLSGKYFHS